MAIALLAVVSNIANLAVGAVLFIWLTVALALMFAALPRWGMPLVGAIGMAAAVLLALFLIWATAGGTP